MKPFYRILMLLSLVLFSSATSASTIKEKPRSLKDNVVLPTANISANTTSICVDGVSPIVTFVGLGGVAPYTFTYTINGVLQPAIATTLGNSVSVDVPTGTVGSFIYQLVSVSDTMGSQPQAGAVTVNVNNLHTVSFTTDADANTCAGEEVFFTPTVTGGTAPFTYLWDFGDGNTSALQDPGHAFSVLGCGGTGTFNVNVTVTDVNGCSATSPNQPVTVKRSPNIALEDTNQVNPFSNCDNNPTPSDPNYTITLNNISIDTACIVDYSIDWGDGTVQNNFSAASFPISHTYTELGSFSLIFSALGSNGCVTNVNYTVANQTNPAGSLGLLGSTTNLCAPAVVPFTISNWELNSPGTTYLLEFGDGESVTLDHPLLSNIIEHIYTTTSCPSQSFTATLTVINACSETPFTAGNIQVRVQPDPSFTNPPIGCVTDQICFTNTTALGTSGGNCSSSTNYSWDFGDPASPTNILNITSAVSPPPNACHIFSGPGNYTVTLTVSNFCGTESFTNDICIEGPITPSFTVSDNNGCAPFAVTTTNTSIALDTCQPVTYLWTVAYANGNCGAASNFIFTNGTTATSANPSFSFLTAGTYTLTLTATNSCGNFTTSQVITVKQPPTATVNPIADVCGPVTINPTAVINGCAPVSEPLTYAWSFPGGTPATASTAVPGAISYTIPGDYTVSLVVTNECGASTVATELFTINTIPVLTNTDLDQTICSGAQTALVALLADAPGTTFTWTATATAGITGFTPSGTTNTIPIQTITTANTVPGTVTYAITPALGGCIGVVTNYVITVNPAPVFTTQPVSSTVCEGGTPTLLQVAIANATGTPEYQWYSNTVSNTVSGTLIPGAESTTYNPPSSVVGTLYYYCIISLPSGSCSNIASDIAAVTIVESPAIVTQPTVAQDLCVGATIGTPLTVTHSGGTATPVYQWFSNTTNSNTGGTLIPGAANATYTPPVFTSSGTYYFYVTLIFSGSGCGVVTSNTAAIVVADDPIVSSQPLATQTLCQGATPADLTVVATGGIGTFSYQWFSNTANNNTSGTLIPGATNATFIPPTTTVGTLYYYCTISQPTAGCSATSATAEVIINPAPIFTTQPVSSSACEGGTPTALSVAYSNGVGTPTYQWYSNTANTTIGATLLAGETNPTYNPPSASVGVTYYFCIITFASGGGCSSITSDIAAVEITSGPSIITQPLATQSLCVGGTISAPLSIAYSGGAGTPAFQWYSNATNSNTGGTLIPGATNSDYTPPVFAAAGNFYFYAVVTLSGSGCSPATTDTAEVIVVDDPMITTQPLVAQDLCQGAAPIDLTVAATGGIGTYSYQWFSNTANNNTSGTLIPGATNATFTPPTTVVGTTYYYVGIIQDGVGCNVTSATAEVIVNIAPSITTQPSSSNICLGETPTLLTVGYTNGVGTPSYQWYSNTVNSTVGGTLIPGETNSTFAPPSASVGTNYYFVEIIFTSGGCSQITSDVVTVTINQNPVISAQNAVICSGNTFTITPDGLTGDMVPLGTTYTWSAPVISPAGAVTGASAEAIPQTSISQALINTTSNPATVTYTVTPVSGICTGNDFTVTVTVNPAINPNIVVTDSACFGADNGSIQTNITGGIPFNTGDPYILSWTGPDGFTSSATTISNLEPGIYDVTITDAGGCPFSDSFTILEPAAIVITIDSENDVTCFGADNGAIAITISGGIIPYSYTWTKDTLPFATTEDLADLQPGAYEVSVSDANNCGPVTAIFTITEPPVLALALLNQTNVLCFGAATGAINVEVTGGTPNYNFAWTGPDGFTSATQNLSGILAGDYNLVVTDNSGCTQMLSVTITQPTDIVITATTTEITCYGGNNASITVAVSGGNGPYQIAWSNLGTGTFQDNLSAGDYTITVTDASNCQKALTVNIPEAPLFDVAPVVTNISCFGANDGSINLNFVGGIAPITLVWSDGSNAGTVRNNLGPGTYTVTITDSKPCVINETFVILEPQALVLTANTTNAFDCDNANSGAINLLVAGGTAPFAYLWSNGSTTEDLVGIPAGNYQVTVTDARGCTQTGQYVINRQPPIVITVNTETIADCEAKDIRQTFEAVVSGGVPPYQLDWSSGTVSGANNEFMETTQAGTVILDVTDSLGCTANYTFDVEIPQIGDTAFDLDSFAFTNFGTYSINDPIQFTNTSTGEYDTLVWNFGDGTFSNEENPVHIYTSEGSYVVTLTVTYAFGCTYTHTITLLVDRGYKLMMPTGFTPNDDTINDTFSPVSSGLEAIELSVYDTWGELIYFEKGQTIRGWDGKLKGRDAENGNYFFKVIGTTFYGTEIKEDGPFTLIK